MNPGGRVAASESCFFVLGYGRSGTTLFRRMLAAHPRLAVAQENDAFQILPPLIGRGVRDADELARLSEHFPTYYRDVYDVPRFLREGSQALPLGPAQVLAMLQRSSRIRALKSDAVWGHKSPSEWPYVATWRRWYPEARFLHIVRDPHDATASMNEYQLQRYPTTPLVAIWQWRRAFRSIRRQGSLLGPQRYLMLRYEDLVSDPRAVLTSVCRFLEVDEGEVAQMLDYSADPSAEYVDPGVHMERTGGPLTDERVGRAATTYTNEQMAMVDELCRTELATLGYPSRAARPASAARRAAYEAGCAALDGAWNALRIVRRARRQL